MKIMVGDNEKKEEILKILKIFDKDGEFAKMGIFRPDPNTRMIYWDVLLKL